MFEARNLSRIESTLDHLLNDRVYHHFRGIHARPGREKIFSKNVAHVLNDELQRKFIQGLKRLITKAQQYFPTDPSRSIDYVRSEDQK